MHAGHKATGDSNVDSLTPDLTQMTVASRPSNSVTVNHIPRVPVPRPANELVGSTLGFGKSISSDLKVPHEIFELTKRAPTLTMVPARPTSTTPWLVLGGGLAPGAKFNLTVGAGIAASASIGLFGAGDSVGFYGSTTHELGTYTSHSFLGGIGFGFNVGAEYSIVFGTPADFSGPFIAFAASYSIPGSPISVGGAILFSPIPHPGPVGIPTLAFVGFAWTPSVSIGPSLPFSMQVIWSNTSITPRVHLR
jgi:hypothetical protein